MLPARGVINNYPKFQRKLSSNIKSFTFMIFMTTIYRNKTLPSGVMRGVNTKQATYACHFLRILAGKTVDNIFHLHLSYIYISHLLFIEKEKKEKAGKKKFKERRKSDVIAPSRIMLFRLTEVLPRWKRDRGVWEEGSREEEEVSRTGVG